MVAPRVVTPVQTMEQAKEVRLLCPHCNGTVFVSLEWPYLRIDRQRKIREAIDEHRKNCFAAPPEAQRVYRIDYPRG